MTTEPQTKRFTVDQYERMVETGVLTENDRVELIDGEIVEKVAPRPEHSTVVQRLAHVLWRALGDRAIIRVQDAVRLPPRSEPEPDVVVALPPDSRYLHQHPEPADIIFVVEVAVTTQTFDRRRKLPMYAREGIAEAWVIDVPSRTIEVYRDPAADGFSHMEVRGAGAAVSPQAFPEIEVTVDELIP